MVHFFESILRNEFRREATILGQNHLAAKDFCGDQIKRNLRKQTFLKD
jgi:hypothetical protein